MSITSQLREARRAVQEDRKLTAVGHIDTVVEHMGRYHPAAPHFSWKEIQVSSKLPPEEPDVERPVSRYSIFQGIEALAKDLEVVRRIVDRPLIVTSWYRSPDHHLERDKPKLGAHCYGCAVDLAVDRALARDVIEAWLGPLDNNRIGIKQKGSGRFLHLDIADQLVSREQFPPWIWSY